MSSQAQLIAPLSLSKNLTPLSPLPLQPIAHSPPAQTYKPKTQHHNKSHPPTPEKSPPYNTSSHHNTSTTPPPRDKHSDYSKTAPAPSSTSAAPAHSSAQTCTTEGNPRTAVPCTRGSAIAATQRAGPSERCRWGGRRLRKR